jgi:glycosyltransferase involved in cell wall biosynthesis
MVHHGVNGLLVQPGDADQLAAALGTLVRDPDLRHRMGSAGLELARREHDAEANNRELVELVRSCAIDEAPGGPADKLPLISAPSR